MFRSRLAVACGALLVSAVIAGPAYADPCLDDHPAGTAASVVLRGRLAAEKTVTATERTSRRAKMKITLVFMIVQVVGREYN